MRDIVFWWKGRGNFRNRAGKAGATRDGILTDFAVLHHFDKWHHHYHGPLPALPIGNLLRRSDVQVLDDAQAVLLAERPQGVDNSLFQGARRLLGLFLVLPHAAKCPIEKIIHLLILLKLDPSSQSQQRPRAPAPPVPAPLADIPPRASLCPQPYPPKTLAPR